MLKVLMKKIKNKLIGEDIVTAQLIQECPLDFHSFCEAVAHGTSVSAADVAMVLTAVEMRLPSILALSSKVVCSPNGLTFRPKISGSITQSQLTAKLKSKAAAHPDQDIDVERPLTDSDLTISDLTVGIVADIPKKWLNCLIRNVALKRVKNTDAH